MNDKNLNMPSDNNKYTLEQNANTGLDSTTTQLADYAKELNSDETSTSEVLDARALSKQDNYVADNDVSPQSKNIFKRFGHFIKRLYIYQKEMLPFWKSIFISALLFFQIYLYVIIIGEIGNLNIGVQEFVVCFSLFAFLYSLRIADDLKDIEVDKRLFAHRPIPSGRTKKKDIIILLVLLNVASITLNVVFMRDNPFYFIAYAALLGYGVLMSVWFFARSKIQPNLILALFTHNPIGVIINSYVIVFTSLRFNLPIFTINNLLLALTLYWPTLIWEISRKVKAPKDENDYVTYSKIFGYKKITLIILIIITIDLVTSSILMFQLWPWGLFAVVAAYVWFVVRCIQFYKKPTSLKIGKQVEIYTAITETPMIIIQALFILFVWIL